MHHLRPSATPRPPYREAGPAAGCARCPRALVPQLAMAMGNCTRRNCISLARLQKSLLPAWDLTSFAWAYPPVLRSPPCRAQQCAWRACCPAGEMKTSTMSRSISGYTDGHPDDQRAGSPSGWGMEVHPAIRMAIRESKMRLIIRDGHPRSRKLARNSAPPVAAGMNETPPFCAPKNDSRTSKTCPFFCAQNGGVSFIPAQNKARGIGITPMRNNAYVTLVQL